MQRSFDHWRYVPPGYWRWPNFRPEEIACRGTGKLVVDEEAMDALQQLRDRLKAPIIVTSAYRSETHNRKIGGMPDSEHLKGRAFDIVMANHDPEQFQELARQVGFLGFGRYPARGFIHIDIGKPRVWGEAFPPRRHRFAPEPVLDPIASTGTVQAAGGAVAVSGAVAAAAELAQVVAPHAEGLTALLRVLGPWVVVLGVAVVAAWFIWRRVRERRERGT